jgi:iron only hydrogenase large subunit-like protein/nitrogen-specific signal transduction histidine kinase
MTGSAVYTEGEICKKCYSCVRSCPTKAIEVHSGQADIIDANCISCGYCVNMCSQNAKRIHSSVPSVAEILNEPDDGPRMAIVAPSFPAAFLDVDPGAIISALRASGFDGVYEVAFGADLVSYEYYRRFRGLAGDPSSSCSFLISSPCPAIVGYVEKVHPELVPYLAGVMSPMEAMAQVLRSRVASNAKIVFVGPCVAKKEEAGRSALVDEVLTFQELLSLFEARGVDYHTFEPSEFDPPRANLGRLYPITGGLLKAASIDDDVLGSPVYVVEGQDRVSDLLTVLSDRVKSETPCVNKLFDLLFCEGCIAGPVIPNDLTFFERRRYIIQYMKNRPLQTDIEQWAKDHSEYLSIDLSKEFRPSEIDDSLPSDDEIRQVLAKTNKLSEADELNCRACGYNSCRDKAVAVIKGTAEVDMCLPYLISQLETVISDLQSNQARLIQAEKLASMGQMAAGIAHEINNPLGVVLMYAHLLKEELNSGSTASEDADTIIREAERTRKIVQGILNFSRKEKIDRIDTDINQLIHDAVGALTGVTGGSAVEVSLDLDTSMAVHVVDPSQLRQVLDNILKNAVELMPDGGKISVTSTEGEEAFTVRISDTGPGIPQEHLSQVFSPFFTTKPVGKGTGLGLPVCYGIVKMHGGTIQAGNNDDSGAFFEITIKHYAREENIASYIYS